MLTPLFTSTSLTFTSSQKLTAINTPCPSLDPDFFKQLTTGVGLSCTYTTEFYEAFSQNSQSSQLSELAMLVLEYMTLHDKARLPLFEGASDRYVREILPAIKEKLATSDGDRETQTTKIHIMNCASKLGYLTDSALFEEGKVMLCHVSLIGMDLRNARLNRARLFRADLSGADLAGADLSGANLIHANLTGANLISTKLKSTNLRSANLSYANLRGTDLRSANLMSANLSDTDLREANLHESDLSLADLFMADL